MNAISPQVIQDLGKVWEEVKSDDEVKAMVVYSSLPVVFSAGADIKAFTSMDEKAGAELINNGHALLRELGQNSKSTVAAVNAIAFGGGCELSMACDFRIAAESASFGQPEINLGIIPGFGGTQRLVRRIGLARARELIYLGRMISAEEALRLGLANRVVSHERLAEEAANLAAELAGRAPVALAQAKRATAVAADADLETGCRFETEAFGVTFATEDRVEGLKAFLEKRPPAWKGR
jgi:enoyl-CoA hydratase/3-hydroxyacyl-CoA dehydrogenase